MSLSILISSYNYAHFLPECIESVLSQSYADFELIIVDDASTDNSWSIIQLYAKKDSRIRILKHEFNKGLHQVINTGLALSKATYFQVQSADDIFLPGFLEKTLRFLTRHPEIGLCCSDAGCFYEKESAHIQSVKLLKKFTLPTVFPPSMITRFFRNSNFWLPGTNCIVKRASILKHGPFDPELYSLQDWFLYHKIALFEGAGYIPETLTAMRLHPHAFSLACSQSESIQKKIRERLFQLLEEPTNREVRARFKKAALLGAHFKNFNLLKDPKFWDFYPYLLNKFLHNRWNRLRKND